MMSSGAIGIARIRIATMYLHKRISFYTPFKRHQKVINPSKAHKQIAKFLTDMPDY